MKMPTAQGTNIVSRIKESASKIFLKATDPFMRRRIDSAVGQITTPLGSVANESLTFSGDAAVGININNAVEKAYIPEYLFRPLFGRPRNINIPEIRRLAKTPTPHICIKTIVDEVTSVDWEIVMKDKEASINDTAIDEVTLRIQNPNRNKEDFRMIMKKWIRDILETDSAVGIKIFDKASFEDGDPLNKLLPVGRRNMLEFYAFDGGTFTKAPNEHGILPDQRAYYQFSPHRQSAPIPFARDELVWMECNPQTSNIYGISPMQVAFDVIRYEVFGVTSGIDLFTRNNVPKGVISIIDANPEHVREFQGRMEDRVTIQDPVSNELRWNSSNMPVINSDIKFTPLQIPPETMRLLESQQWYIKLIFACFGVTPSEAGFTDDSNRATDIVQSEVFRRKAILPMMDTLEFFINNEIIPEFGWDDVKFQFVRRDIQEDLREQTLSSERLEQGLITINEWRQVEGLDPVSWGNEPLQSSGFGNPFNSTGSLDYSEGLGGE